MEREAKIQEFGLANEPWFTQLSKAMKRYGVDWGDLAEGNVGIDMRDHTLKIIDASVFSDQAGEKNWNEGLEREILMEKCWPSGYEKKGMKKMFGKMYPNCVKKEKKNEEVELSEADPKIDEVLVVV